MSAPNFLVSSFRCQFTITPWAETLYRQDNLFCQSTQYGANQLPTSELNLTGPLMYTDNRNSELGAAVLPPRSDGVDKTDTTRVSTLGGVKLSKNDSESIEQKPVRVVRSLFVSDVHLGCKHSQANEFLDLLERFEPRYLYIVGDFIDGWKLKGKWRWLPVYDRIIQRLMVLKHSGTRIFYTPGNHDSFLRNYVANFGVIDVCDRFIHEAGDGRRFVVTHGDQFDRIEQSAQWLSVVASYAYDLLLTSNWFVNKVRGKKHDPYAFCGAIKRRVKLLVKHVSDFEDQLAKDATKSGCEGIICGHIHAPRIQQIGSVHYLNTGDWVESCSALVEFEEGRFDLIRRDGEIIDRLEACPDTRSNPALEQTATPLTAAAS